ncbi:MAG TPA: phosphatase PAP2 family protein [Bacteroidales bacterium]|nr:phosphatase PAP2 family protein [Bacteroidales bacterium]
MLEFLKNIDTQLFLFLNSLHSPLSDKLMWWFSGTKFWIPLYLIIVVYMVYKFRWKAVVSLIFIALAVTLADQVSVHAFKNVFMRLRPCHTPELQEIVHLVNNKCGGQYGFVSSHAANTFAVAFFLSRLFKNKGFTYFIFFWASIVSYSRIYLGVHYPLDIIGGAVLGYFIGLAVFYLHQQTVFCLNKKYPKTF